MRANKGRHAGQVPHCKFYFRAWLQLAINFQSSNCNILGACLIYFAIQVTSQCPPSHHHSQKLKFFGPTPPVNVPRELVSFSVLDYTIPETRIPKPLVGICAPGHVCRSSSFQGCFLGTRLSIVERMAVKRKIYRI